MPAEKDIDTTYETNVILELKNNLRLSNSTLSAILKLTDDIIIVLDKNGIIVESSNQVENLFAIPLKDIIGKMSWEHFIFDEDKKRLKGYFSDRSRGVGSPPSTYTLRVNIPGEESRFMRANVGFIPGTEDRIIILKDLSEVVQEQKKTAESEKRYSTVVENTEDGILICNEDRILFANHSFCMMTGLPREEVYTFSPRYFFHEAEKDKFDSIFQKIKDGKQKSLVFEVKIKNNRRFIPAEISCVPMIYRDTEAILFSVRDLTQRNTAEKELKESHRIMKAIVDNSPIGISVHDKNGTLLMANNSWRAIWGKSLEDQKKKMIPRTELRMDDKDSYLGKYMDDVEAVYKNGGEFYIPKLKIKNYSPGGAKIISHHFYAIMDDAGKVDRVVILTLDLSESFETKDELVKSRDQYQELFRNVPVAVYRTTLEGGGKIVSANPEMYRMFCGDKSGDMDSISVKDLYVDSERRNDLMKKLSEKDEVLGFETELKRLDGSTFLASISARYVAGKSKKKKFIEGIIRDITEQRRMEEELQRIEHLQSIGTLAGGIAHDFNNLLMAIQGNISLAHVEKDPFKLGMHLNKADSSIEEAAILARQLLTFAQGGIPIKELVDVTSFIEDTVKFALRGTSIKAAFNFQENIKKIDADKRQIAQVIDNLIINSVQAMTDSGTITVSCSNVEIEKNSKIHLKMGDYVQISIKDTGKGIPAEELKKIFNPYFTTKSSGSGLGLSTSYSIVSKHAGIIKVFSSRGKGTEFVIYLPSYNPDQAHNFPRKKINPFIDNASANILIMDDDPQIRQVLSGMLKVLGHKVTETSDGTEALEIYRKKFSTSKPFDIVILDLTIPGGMGGEAAIKELLEIDPNVRAIVSSGYSNNPVLSDYSDYGFSGELVKPFRISTLKNELKSVLSR